jgi:hypothetical protein
MKEFVGVNDTTQTAAEVSAGEQRYWECLIRLGIYVPPIPQSMPDSIARTIEGEYSGEPR